MAFHIPQDGSGLLPRGMFRLLALEDEHNPHFVEVSHDDMPIFSLVLGASATASRIPSELMSLLQASRSKTGICHFLVEGFPTLGEKTLDDRLRHVHTRLANTIVWLGPSQNDSNAALRLLSRLHDRPPSILTHRLWSKREGQAVLALAQQAAWKQLVPGIIASMPNISIVVGGTSVSWAAVVNFGELLSQLGTHGRLEHQHFAHALLASEASKVIHAVSALELSRTHEATQYPPPVSPFADVVNSEMAEEELSLVLESTVTTVEHRWKMLEHDTQDQVANHLPCDEDLDAEIARYAILLQQMDVLEMDLEQLARLTNTTNNYCRQAEAHTPRASPEIMP